MRDKKAIFVFQNADQRAYFVKTQLPADAQYTVYSQPSAFNAAQTWFYLKLVIPKAKAA